VPNPAALLGVQGPLARSAFDLELLFDLMAGPDAGEDVAWSLAIPAARHDRLADFRVAVMPRLDLAPAAPDMYAKVEELASFLSGKGATVSEAMPGFELEPYFMDYERLLTAMVTTGQSREEREAGAASIRKSADPTADARADGMVMDVPALAKLLGRREAGRAAWRAFFREWDVLIGPMTMDAAFPHAEGSFAERVLTVGEREVSYGLNIVYPMLAIFAGQPSTAFPAGLGRAGLPLGLQAIGPYLEDRTPLRFAQLLEQEWQGFVPPPGY
jgi:amidase